MSNDYLPGRREAHDVQALMTADDDIIFCVYGDLVMMKNGLKFLETKTLELGRKKSPSALHVLKR